MRLLKFVFLIMILTSCGFDKKNSLIVEKSKFSLSGWWVYGEGYHSFLDEASLKEYNLEFLNEDSLGLIELYLSVTEMEYFPMETNIIGHKKDKTFYVEDFEITYIVGCDEEQ